MALKLSYFDMDAGRGEPARLALHYGGIAFTDDRIAFPDWPNRKPHTAWGTVPTLEVTGKGTLGQSAPLLRYVGKLTNLYPKDDFDAARVDDIIDGSEDIILKLTPTLFEKDEAKKKQMRETLISSTGDLTRIIGNLEKILAAHKSKFAVGDNLTVADLKIFVLTRWLKSGKLDHIPKEWVDQFTHIVQIFTAVNGVPKIAEYYASRQPKST